MNVSIITVFPQLYEAFFQTSLIKRAQEKGLISFNVIAFSAFCEPKQRIDEPTCGPGAGMVIKPSVVDRAINHCQQHWGPAYKIFFSPQGRTLNQDVLSLLAEKMFLSNDREDDPSSPEEKVAGDQKNHLLLVAARYEGMDARVEEHFADLMLSLGDFVLMGGDIPVQAFLEGLLRLMPSVVGKEESIKEESFAGPWLDYPSYGLPLQWHGKSVPEIVTSGDHAAIEQWRREQAAQKTIHHRFDYFVSRDLSSDDKKLGTQFIPSHYVALMHNQVKIKDRGVGHTSITSLDIHDIARSSRTYGVSKMFVVSSLEDQHHIMKTFINFWRSAEGLRYNPSRFEAMSLVSSQYALADAIALIEQQEGKKPILIATSAKEHPTVSLIGFDQQGEVWRLDRPVLFLFGTGQGLADELIEQCDYMLDPVAGLTDYNHLSVRSAAGIVLDRWLGLHQKKQTLSL